MNYEIISGECIIPYGETKISSIQGLYFNSIEIPESVVEICDDAFSGCKCVDAIKLPNTIKRIGHRSFKNCDSLETIEIPNILPEIDRKELEAKRETMYYCPPADYFRWEIGRYAFFGCKSLKCVELPNRIKINWFILL